MWWKVTLEVCAETAVPLSNQPTLLPLPYHHRERHCFIVQTHTHTHTHAQHIHTHTRMHTQTQSSAYTISSPAKSYVFIILTILGSVLVSTCMYICTCVYTYQVA